MNGDSPFAVAKTLRDIGSYYPVDFGGQPYDREEHRRAGDRWAELRETPLPLTVENQEFFNSRLLDSDVIGLRFTSTLVKLTLDSFRAQKFANGVCDAFDVPRRRRKWPVDLLMHEPTYVRSVLFDRAGDLRTVNLEEISLDEPGHMGDFVNDWFFVWDGHLGWVVELFNVGYSEPGNASPIHLLVDCARASADDRRLDALIDEFGPAVAPLWRDVLRDFDLNNTEDRRWIADEIAEYLPDRLIAHGLTRDNLVLPSVP